MKKLAELGNIILTLAFAMTILVTSLMLLFGVFVAPFLAMDGEIGPKETISIMQELDLPADQALQNAEKVLSEKRLYSEQFRAELDAARASVPSSKMEYTIVCPEEYGHFSHLCLMAERETKNYNDLVVNLRFAKMVQELRPEPRN